MIENMRITRYKTNSLYGYLSAPSATILESPTEAESTVEASKTIIPDSEISDGMPPVLADSEARPKRVLAKRKFLLTGKPNKACCGDNLPPNLAGAAGSNNPPPTP